MTVGSELASEGVLPAGLKAENRFSRSYTPNICRNLLSRCYDRLTDGRDVPRSHPRRDNQSVILFSYRYSLGSYR
jgi:hypothetical protein